MREQVVWLAVVLTIAACDGRGAGDGGGPAVDAAPGSGDDGGDGDDGGGGLVGDPAEPGRDPVHCQDDVPIALGGASTVRGTVCSPADGGGAPAPGPFPLIVVSSGYQLARSQYRGYCEHLASWGHVCVTHDYAASGNHQDKAREVGKIIDWALGTTSGLAVRVDGARIGVAGHSLGGKVSINAAMLTLPPFGNDGSASVTPEMMGALRVPIAVLGELTDASGGLGGLSCAPAADNYQQFFERACAAAATLEVTIAMADHMDWIGDRGACGLACLACQSGQTTDATVHAITRRVTTAWFERHLRDVAAMDAWLAPGMIGVPTTVRTAPGC